MDSFLSAHKGCWQAHKPHINMTTDQWGREQSDGIVDVLAGFTSPQRWIGVQRDWRTFHSLGVLTSIIDEWEQFMEGRKKEIRAFNFAAIQ